MKTILYTMLLLTTMISQNLNPSITELKHITELNPTMINGMLYTHKEILNLDRIAELKEMRKEFETIVNSQDTKEQQKMIQYQIGTITLLLIREVVQLTEAHEHIAEIQETDDHEQPEAPVIDYDEHQPPLVSNAGSINNYETTPDFLRRLKKKKRNGCWNW